MKFIGNKAAEWRLQFVPQWGLLFGLSILYGAFLFLFYPAFETNDDSIMQGIASGIFNVQNSEASLFTHFLYGCLIKSFYMWFPNLNWYGIFLAIFHIGSAFLIGIQLNKRIKNSLQLYLGLMLIITFSFYFLLKLQFTSTAFIICVTGMIYLIQFLYDSPNSIKYFIISFCLFFLGALIRWDTFLATILFSILPISIAYWKNRTKKYIWIYLCSFLLLGIIPISQTLYYENELHSDYIKYQETAHQLLDYNFEFDLEKLDELGWTENDLLLFETYFRADSIFSFQNLNRIRFNSSPKYDFLSAIEIVFNLTKSFVFGGICFFIMVLYLMLSRQRFKYLFALSFVLMHVGFILLAAHFKLPLRVYLPSLFLFAITLYDQFLREGLKIVLQKYFSTVIISFIFAICILQTSVHWHIQKENRMHQNEFQDLKRTIEVYKNTMIVFVDCPFPYFQFPVFQETVFQNGTSIIPLATFTGSPAYQLILDFYQIENFTSDLKNKEIIFISGETNFFEYYQIFLDEHFQIKIEYEDLEELPFAKKIIWKN